MCLTDKNVIHKKQDSVAAFKPQGNKPSTILKLAGSLNLGTP